MIQRLAYSPSEVAELLGTSRQYVYDLIAAGQLRSVKARGRRLVPSDSIDELLGVQRTCSCNRRGARRVRAGKVSCARRSGLTSSDS